MTDSKDKKKSMEWPDMKDSLEVPDDLDAIIDRERELSLKAKAMNAEYARQKW